MSYRRMIAGGVLTAVLGWGGEAGAGWLIEQTAKTPTGGGRQQLFIQANRMKTLTFGPDGQPAHAVIVDLNAETLTQVDYGDRQYVTATLQEYVQTMTGAAQAAAGQMAEARKQMEQAMKTMPPEQRKAMEQMLRGQMAQGGPGGAPCVEPQRELRKTAQQATIAGYPAVRWEVLADGRVESEVWVAPGLGAAKELDARKLEQFAGAMSRVVACGPGGGAGKADPAWKLAAEGYPVRTIVPAGGVTLEVVKAESRAVPATEFQPPAGFARKTLREMLGR
jgi:hypothetical protein